MLKPYHLIRKDPIQPIVLERNHPIEPLELVRPHGAIDDWGRRFEGQKGNRQSVSQLGDSSKTKG